MSIDPVLPISGATGSPVQVSATQFRRLAVGSTMAHDAHAVAARAGVGAGLTATVSGLTVTIQPGSAVVTPLATSNGSYWASVAAASSVALAARDATYSRRDLIVLRVRDGEADSTGFYVADLLVVTGSPAVSPAIPATPSGTLPLWAATVPPSGTVTLADQRVWTSALGGVITCLSNARPAGTSLRLGQHIFETDTQSVRVWTGSAWSLISSHSRMATVGFTHSASTDANGYFTVPAIPWGGLTPVSAPAAVSWQDAMTSMTVGPVFPRWDIAQTTSTSTRCKVFQSSGSGLPNYPVRLGVTVTGLVTG